MCVLFTSNLIQVVRVGSLWVNWYSAKILKKNQSDSARFSTAFQRIFPILS